MLAAWLWQPAMGAWAAAVAVVLPVGLLLTLTAENLVFLLLPWRIGAGEATMQSVGRNLLTTMLTFARGHPAHGVAVRGLRSNSGR